MKIKYFYIPFGILIYMCAGSVYSWSIFRKPLEEILKITATQSGTPYMLFLLFFALMMPVGGKIMPKIGPFKTIFIGTILLSLGFLLSGFLKTITAISISYGIISGLGVGLIYGTPIAVVAKWFPEKKGLFMGLTLAGFGLSPFVTAPLSRYLVSLYGPFETLKILGIAFFVVITILSFSLKFPKEEKVSQSEQKNESFEYKKEFTTKEMLKTKEFYGLWFCYTIGTFAGLMAIGITSPFAQEIIKLDAGSAAIFISIFSVFNAVGRPLFGFLADKLKAFKVILLLFFIIIISSLIGLMLKENLRILFFITFALFYLILGGWLATAPAVTSTIFGLKNYTSNYGVVYTAYGAGAVIGSLISGRLKDTLGSYSYVFYPTIILSLVGIIINIVTLRKHK